MKHKVSTEVREAYRLDGCEDGVTLDNMSVIQTLSSLKVQLDCVNTKSERGGGGLAGARRSNTAAHKQHLAQWAAAHSAASPMKLRPEVPAFLRCDMVNAEAP